MVFVILVIIQPAYALVDQAPHLIAQIGKQFSAFKGNFGWLTSVSVSVAVPIVFFLVFERWFLVPLPKGPLEQLLGF